MRITPRRSSRRAAGILLTLAGCLIAATAPPAAAAGTRADQSPAGPCTPGSYVLYAGCQLQRGQALDLGTLAVTMQGDGNVVLSDQGHPMWANNEGGHPNSYLAMQYDGNLVEYSSQGTAVWASNTATAGANAYLLQGGFAVYASSGGSPLWTTPVPGTTFADTVFPNDVTFSGQTLGVMTDLLGHYALQWQEGGMLGLVYRPLGQTLYHLGSPCSTAATAVMQADGNFVIICNGAVTFATNTGGHPASAGIYLHLETTGTLELATSNGTPILLISPQ